jgi:hypothetical protein
LGGIVDRGDPGAAGKAPGRWSVARLVGGLFHLREGYSLTIACLETIREVKLKTDSKSQIFAMACEELQMLRDEMQSLQEELKPAKEELQFTNEKL